MIHKLKGNWGSHRVWLEGKELHVENSKGFVNHSSEFSWGYYGSGPSQLALAILLELYNSRIAMGSYQHFKHQLIGQLPQSDFEIEFDADPVGEIVILSDWKQYGL